MGSEPSSPAKYHYERRMAQPNAAPVSVQPAAPIHAAMTNRAVYPSHTPEHYPTHPYAAAAVSRPAPVHDVEASQPYQYRPERDHQAKTVDSPEARASTSAIDDCPSASSAAIRQRSGITAAT
ncbi:hypothetical protein AG1IA_01755 [Rhizoctonia solani AG-1 IA]|uniref:Uncharacterized protein n=1 Tax=Thanatephorus cucumeris (strain AG1-IA) TaxID=983506 RepID=L8X533_THACA|nr:hypothetical protein AG1IA_01755 [Rhizoctonia solani AG-1 IA]